MDPIKLDLGPGSNKISSDFIGIDIDKYEGVDIVMDLRYGRLPYNDETVEHVRASHFVEHLTFDENIHLFNEVWRVLRPGGIFEVIVPHGMSYAGMVDLSHKTFWTEDTFGYFTPENKYFYAWFYERNGERIPVINQWKVQRNDSTPPIQYTKDGWVEVKLREVHAYLEKLPWKKSPPSDLM